MASPVANSLFTAWLAASGQREAQAVMQRQEAREGQTELLHNVMDLSKMSHDQQMGLHEQRMTQAQTAGSLAGTQGGDMPQMTGGPAVQEAGELAFAQAEQTRYTDKEKMLMEQAGKMEERGWGMQEDYTKKLVHDLDLYKAKQEYSRAQGTDPEGRPRPVFGPSELGKVPKFMPLARKLGNFEKGGLMQFMDTKGQLAYEQLSKLAVEAEGEALLLASQYSRGSTDREIYGRALQRAGNETYAKYVGNIGKLLYDLAHSKKAARLKVGQTGGGGGYQGGSTTPQSTGRSWFQQQVGSAAEGVMGPPEE